MTSELHILIVDDDLKLRTLLSKYLSEQNFQVTDAASSEEADQHLATGTFDLMVLDCMMPRETGLDYCKRLRQSGNLIPIIMLSAKGEDIDKIIGLEMGMDDYLSKPFNPRELVARIKAIARRPQAQQSVAQSALYPVGSYQFDRIKRQLVSAEQDITELTSSEYDLLTALIAHANRPLSRDQLMQILHAKDFEVFDRSIDVLVSRLRKLVETNPAKPQVIKTVWGVGYMLVSEVRD